MLEGILAAGLGLALLGGLYAIFKWGQTSQAKKEREQDVQEANNEADIIIRQRDDRITSVDDADRLFDNYDPKR